MRKSIYKKGISLAEYVALNLDDLNSVWVDIDGERYRYGKGEGNFYLNPMYESLDDLVRKSRSTEVFCLASCQIVTDVKVLRSSGNSVFIRTELV